MNDGPADTPTPPTPPAPCTPALDPQTEAAFGFNEGGDWAARAREVDASQPPLGRFGPYDLLEEIGRGGQGEVYRALQPGTGRAVAIKRLAFGGLGSGEKQRARFVREVEAVTRLSHPGVVVLYGAEVIDRHPVLVMELVEGLRMDAWAEECFGVRGSAPAIPRILRTFARVCDAVAHAHHRGVIHRDLKPSNILIAAGDAPKVLDFGIARVLQESGAAGAGATLTSFAGTPAYAAPEQLQERHGDVDTRSDVYSLGALLYRALSGRDPYPSGLAAVLELMRAGGPAPVSRARPGVPRPLDWIVRRAMHTDPAKRYQTVEALADDVRRFLDGRAVEAHPPSTAYVTRTFLTRHWALAGAAALVVVSLSGATVVSVRSSILTSAALRRAREAEGIAAHEAAVQAGVSDVLTGVLRLANPTIVGGGANVTVRQALDSASGKFLSGDSEVEPEVEQAVRVQIGELYVNIGQVEEARQHFEAVLAIRRSLYGDDDPRLLVPLHFLGRIARDLGDLDGSERILREVVRLRRPLPQGDDGRYLASSLASLGNTLRARGKYAEAEQAHREAIEINERIFSNDDNVAVVHNNLAVTLLAAGRLDEAQEHTDLALRMLLAYPGAPAGDIGHARMALGRILWARGLDAEGEAQMREALEVERAALGDSDRSVARHRFNLAERFAERQRWADAEPLLRSALGVFLRLHPPTSGQTREVEAALASLLTRTGRAGEAERLCLDSLSRGGEAAATIEVLRELGLARAALGRHAEAEESLLQAWNLIQGGVPPPHPHTEETGRQVAAALADLHEVWGGGVAGPHGEEAARWRALAAPAR